MSESVPDYLFSAKGQMYGYLYQIDRTLLWLSRCPDGSIVSIETDDDVVVRLENGDNIETIYEQDKASIKKRYPFTNTNVNLWKTLSNWLTLIETQQINVENSRFLLATNISNKSNCIVKTISAYNVDEATYEKAYCDLLEIANTTKSTSLKPYAEKLIQSDKSVVMSLLRRIELCECPNHYDRKIFLEQIIQGLHLNDEETPHYEILTQLYGWVVNTCMELWLSGGNACFDPKTLWSKRDFLIRQFAQKPFIEKAANLIPVSQIDQDNEKGSLFVKQLDLILAQDDEKLKAIQDFLRAKREKHNYALNANLTKQHLDEYEDGLKENWWQNYSKHRRLNRGEPADVGYAIYSETIQHKGRLAGLEPTYFYLSNGTYHELANKRFIGWHPDWEELTK